MLHTNKQKDKQTNKQTGKRRQKHIPPGGGQLQALGERKSSLGVCTRSAQPSDKATVCYQSLMAHYLPSSISPENFIEIRS